MEDFQCQICMFKRILSEKL